MFKNSREIYSSLQAAGPTLTTKEPGQLRFLGVIPLGNALATTPSLTPHLKCIMEDQNPRVMATEI